MTSPLLVFTTDFGLSDAYAGVMKGVALTINPDLCLIDLTHQILPQNIAQGSFLLGINHRYFPQDAIHVAVVDPGVGTDRRPVLLSTPRGRFVAPDNGLLSGVISGYLESDPTDSGPISLPPELSAVHLTNPEYWRHPVSQTFHGRDVFTPVAAHLSLGVSPEDMGELIDSLVYLPIPQPVQTGGIITGRVIYQDVYGNLVTNISADILMVPKSADVLIKGRSIHGLQSTFNDANGTTNGKLIALAGSHGYLEVAVSNGHAAQFLEVSAGEPVEVVTEPA
ncbi:MAG: SAM-dependent chlorinase/fluorinase [SAR202 cluster bacterium]|nr:SAM-dependent chlorinase/fluorinase [SAR202 cluster bacterium]